MGVSLGYIWNLGHKYSDPDFDQWEFYGNHPFKGFKRRMAGYIKELAGEGESILSLGCGCSPILDMFNCRKVGVDIDKGKLDFFRNHTDAELVVGDITKMEPSREFDIVLLNEVIEHVGYENVDKVLWLVSNSLKPKGRAVVSMPDMGNWLGRLVETTLHKEVHSSLMSSTNLVDRCKRVKLVLKDSRYCLWDVACLFVKEV